MPILGITGLNGTYHDSAACLILDNGEWVAVEEERLNRIKHSSGFPALSIEWCLKETGINKSDIDSAGYFLNMPAHYARYFLKNVYDNPDATDNFFYYSYKLFSYWRNQLYDDICHWLTIDRSKLIPIRHHLAHAASAYYISPFDEAAILTLDGAGDADSACYFLGKGTQIKGIASPMIFPVSIGMMYNFIASYLGLGSVGSSGKLMGLAPYGKPTYIDRLRKIVFIPEKVDDRSVIKFDFRYFEYHLGGSHPIFSSLFYDTFGPQRQRNEPILQHHADLAASMQLLLEDVIIFLAKQLKLLTKTPYLCYAGGVALNIDANIRIKQEAGFDDIFIMPSAYDAGTSIGAALYLHHVHFNRPRVKPLLGAFKGPKYNEDEIKKALVSSGLQFQKIENPVIEAASLLAKGAIIGWFQGREEIGPRALGNRSILMDAGIPTGKDIINQKVKFREAFRPFAPSVPLDEADKYFVSPCSSPFMLYTFKVKDEWQNLLPSITHVDGSARVHTVTPEENALFYDLLKEFGQRRGYSVLLNTSFNVQGQPLVSTPEEAIAVYQHSGLDALVIDSFLVSRHDSALTLLPIERESLPEGVIDSGKTPQFQPFEAAPKPSSYPQGINLQDSEKEVLVNYLQEMRAIAVSQTSHGNAIRNLASLIETIESNLQLQQQIGMDKLSCLWELLAELWCQKSTLDVQLATDIKDEYLLRCKQFPGSIKIIENPNTSLDIINSNQTNTINNNLTTEEGGKKQINQMEPQKSMEILPLIKKILDLLKSK
jgi:carbamoyltransferase